MDLSGYATIPEQAAYLSGLTGVPAASIQAGLELMMANGIDYRDGLDAAEKGTLNKLVTEMVNDGSLNEAMVKKVGELADFLSQQFSR